MANWYTDICTNDQEYLNYLVNKIELPWEGSPIFDPRSWRRYGWYENEKIFFVDDYNMFNFARTCTYGRRGSLIKISHIVPMNTNIVEAAR